METRSYTDIGMLKVSDGRTIEGYAIVFNQESRIIYDKPTKLAFIEIIERGAVTDELLARCDIKAVLEHDKSRLLARRRGGNDSLKLSIDEYGVKYSFIAPNTSDGDFAIEMISRGDIFGSSFNYGVDEKDKRKVSYSKKGGTLYRTVHKIDRISDISLVADPAFYGTDVTVRSLEEIETETPEEIDADSEEKPDDVYPNDYLKHINELKKLI